MKLFRLTLSLAAVILFSFTAQSCTKEKKVTESQPMTEMSGDGHNHSHNEGMSHSNESKTERKAVSADQQKPDRSKLLVAGYLQLKNALVSDNSKEAAIAADVMVKAFKGFNASGFSSDQQKEIAEIIENAQEQVEHIADNADKIEHQREHFEVLSNDMADLVTIVGSDKTLYQTKCPMFNKGKGGIWLGETKEIKNPFYGSKMLTCGSVQKEI